MKTVSLITWVLIGGIIILGCLPSKSYMNYKEKKEKDCTPYYRYLKQNWKMNKDSLFVFLNLPNYDSTLHMANEHFNKPCIIGLTKKQVIRLFGKPSEIEKTKVYSVEKDSLNNNEFIPHLRIKYKYYRRKECFQKGEYKIGCAQLTLTFDELSQKVVDVHLPMVETGPIPSSKKNEN